MTSSIDPTYDNAPDPESSWFYDEGIAGNGQRPEWLPEKFKSVADAAKSYVELEKRVGSAPKEYDVSKGESWIDTDYGPLQDMMEFARNKHVPQDVMDVMLDSVGKYLDEFRVDQNDELKKFGENAQERIQILDNWAKSNLSNESYEALTNNVRTAEGLKALEEMRNLMTANTTTIPNGMHSASQSIPTMQDIQSEMNSNLEKYKTDPSYRAQLMSKMELAAKSSGFEDKRPF